MSNPPPEAGAEGLSDRNKLAAAMEETTTPMTEEQKLKALYPPARIYAITRNGPPVPSLASTGERAMIVLGLSSPSAPSIHIRPSWTMNSIYFSPETRESYIKETVNGREQAQKYARKADKWRHERDELSAELSETGEGENPGKREGKKLRSLYRQACHRVEWYEKKSIRHMTSAYQSALLALHKEAMSPEEILELDKQWKEKWEKARKVNKQPTGTLGEEGLTEKR